MVNKMRVYVKLSQLVQYDVSEKEGSSGEAGDQGAREEPEASTSSQEKSQDAGQNEGC